MWLAIFPYQTGSTCPILDVYKC